LLGASRGWLGGDGVLFSNDERNKMILNWCAEHPSMAPKRVANMMPLEIEDNGKVVWHPIAMAILDNYGSDEEVLEAITANMGSFGTVGSSIPYYNNQKELLLQIKKHANPTVRDWVDSMLDYTDKQIQREKLDEDTMF
jgi:hypothetical protein